MNYWLMKSEPAECSVADALASPNATVSPAVHACAGG